ncbi:MAG: L-threonylcarbamoyladenylate synthase [Lachnospiraceae bacterium]
MNTIQIKITESHIENQAIARAGEIIKAGGLVAFPTETVYGLGGDALSSRASGKIYAAKGRPSDNPLIVHIADMNELEKIASQIPEAARKLAGRFWPGPLTMIFQKTDIVPQETTGGLNTVAVRMPSHQVALALIRAAGGFIAAPSANLSGRPSPTMAKHVAEDLNGRIDMIIDGGAVDIGLESTIVDMTGVVPMILRPGFISREMLAEVLGEVEYDKAILGVSDLKTPPKAPGMKYKHYAPKGALTIVKGAQENVVEYIRRGIGQKQEQGEIVGVIASEETYPLYSAAVVEDIGAREDEEAIARHLYAVLRDFDERGVTCIFSEEFDTPQMGQAIMNRLMKAAGHHIIEVS